MSTNPQPAYVSKADGDEIRVHSTETALEQSLNAIGFTFDSSAGAYTKRVTNTAEKARTFDDVRSLGICFSGGGEWSPAEIFELLRDQELLSGSFKKIVWTDPMTSEVTTV